MSEYNFSECNSVEEAYYQRNRDVILNRAKEFYENIKERRLRDITREKYKNSSEEKKLKRENMEEKDIIKCLKKRNNN